MPTWCFGIAFAAAMAGSVLYFLEAGGHVSLIEPLTGTAHKYSKLLEICAVVLATGCAAFAAGLRAPARRG